MEGSRELLLRCFYHKIVLPLPHKQFVFKINFSFFPRDQMMHLKQSAGNHDINSSLDRKRVALQVNMERKQRIKRMSHPQTNDLQCREKVVLWMTTRDVANGESVKKDLTKEVVLCGVFGLSRKCCSPTEY